MTNRVFEQVEKDNSWPKNERRAIIHELCALQTSFLGTDYPGEHGRKFIRKLHHDRPDLQITLVNKQSFHKDIPGDSLVDVATKMRGDIFDIMQYHSSPIVDIDLFGGLSQQDKEKIETAPHWKKLLITFSRTWRHKTLPGALSKGEDPAYFMEMWSKRLGWTATMPMLPLFNPYRHETKKAIMGITDRRGPRYWTFLLER